jgi:hypothetical protein
MAPGLKAIKLRISPLNDSIAAYSQKVFNGDSLLS